MKDRNALFESTETPEDVAALYSWANLHGARYRDFSASRAKIREKARQRVQEAIDAGRRAREQAETQKAAAALHAADVPRLAEASLPCKADRLAEWTAGDNAAKIEQQAAEEAARRGEPPTVQRQPALPPADAPDPPYSAPDSAYPAAVVPYAPHPAPYPPPAYAPPVDYAVPGYPAPVAGYGTPALPLPYSEAQNPSAPPYPTYTQTPAYGAPVTPTSFAPCEENSQDNHGESCTPWVPWGPADPRDTAPRPAWLSERPGMPAPVLPPAPAEALVEPRDRQTSRWFALKGIFSGAVAAAPAEPAPAPLPAHAPVLAIFSLAGGVGKTSLVATLGRALSSRGERVLLVETASFGILPFFFGARDQRPGVLRTFSPPGASGDAPIQLLAMDPETLGPENLPQESLSTEISRQSRGASRILVDLATAAGATTRRILRLAPIVLVPVVPDMSSVVSVGAIDSFFKRHPSASGQPILPFYILNQFDPSLPLHRDIREVLREQMGDRLLPFELRRAPAISEALAEGMTVMDYAPTSPVAEDFSALAEWVKSLAAPAADRFRGIRWSKR